MVSERLRIALLELADNSRVVSVGSATRNVPIRKFDNRGNEKVPIGDIFEEESHKRLDPEGGIPGRRGDEERGEIR